MLKSFSINSKILIMLRIKNINMNVLFLQKFWNKKPAYNFYYFHESQYSQIKKNILIVFVIFGGLLKYFTLVLGRFFAC